MFDAEIDNGCPSMSRPASSTPRCMQGLCYGRWDLARRASSLWPLEWLAPSRNWSSEPAGSCAGSSVLSLPAMVRKQVVERGL